MFEEAKLAAFLERLAGRGLTEEEVAEFSYHINEYKILVLTVHKRTEIEAHMVDRIQDRRTVVWN